MMDMLLATAAQAERESVAQLCGLLGLGGAILMRQAIERDPALQTDAVANGLLDHLEMSYTKMSQFDAYELTKAAEIACRKSRCNDLLCRVWKDLANACLFRGMYTEAAAALDRADEYGTKTLDPHAHCSVVIYARAALAHELGHTEEAIEYLDKAIKCFEERGDVARAISARMYRVYVNFSLNRFAECLEDYREAVRLAVVRGDEEDEAAQIGNMAACLVRLGDYTEAKRCYNHALMIYCRHGAIMREARLKVSMSYLAFRCDGIEAGLARLERARARVADLGMPGFAARALTYAVDIIVELDPDSYLIVPLCKRIQIEAGRLDLTAHVAIATERLRFAALRGDVADIKLLTHEVRALISVGAQYRANEAN